MKHGPGPNGFIRSLGQYMLGSAATFGSVYTVTYGYVSDNCSFFMSIGTAIRTEAPPECSIAMQAFAKSRNAPILMRAQHFREESQ